MIKNFSPLFFLFLGLVFTPSLVWSEDNSGPAQLFLAKTANKVSVVHRDAKHQANPPETLAENDRVVTGSSSQAYLEFQNGGVVEVGPNSDVKVSQLEITPRDFKAKFLLAFGKLKAKVKKLTSSSSRFEIQAGGVVAGVRGTIFGVDYDKAKNVVHAQTFEGSIFTLVGGKEQIVEKGVGLVVDKTGLPLKSVLSSQTIRDFTEFNGVSDLLEKKKEEMINKARDRAANAVKDKVKDDVIKKVIDPSKFGF